MEKITAELRVTTLKVQPFAYKDGKGEMVGGETMEVRAAGFYEADGDHFPASLHIVTYPGHGIIPVIGDCVKITVERA